jgi:hypothetical protein
MYVAYDESRALLSVVLEELFSIELGTLASSTVRTPYRSPYSSGNVVGGTFSLHAGTSTGTFLL